jgi:hypothetical protein
MKMNIKNRETYIKHLNWLCLMILFDQIKFLFNQTIIEIATHEIN